MMVEADLNRVFYARPAEYRRRLEAVISAKGDVLEPYWGDFIEHKASRDVGLHNGWRRNELYARKTGDRARNADDKGYIYPSDRYFASACGTAISLADALENHCASVFAKCCPAFVFRDMWERSALQRVVQFEKAWTLYGPDSVGRNSDFSWGWSTTEDLVYTFFNHLFTRRTPPDIIAIRDRWAGSETVRIVDEWLEAPFFL